MAIGPGVCRKGGSGSQAYTHTNAAGFPRFSTKDASRHDESEDRRNWSVTEVFFSFLKLRSVYSPIGVQIVQFHTE